MHFFVVIVLIVHASAITYFPLEVNVTEYNKWLHYCLQPIHTDMREISQTIASSTRALLEIFQPQPRELLIEFSASLETINITYCHQEIPRSGMIT